MTFSTIRIRVRSLLSVTEMLRVPGLSGFCGDARAHSGSNSSKGGYEVVWEKFGRRAESLARRDPAGSF